MRTLRESCNALLPLTRFENDTRPHIKLVEGDGALGNGNHFIHAFSQGSPVFTVAADGTIGTSTLAVGGGVLADPTTGNLKLGGTHTSSTPVALTGNVNDWALAETPYLFKITSTTDVTVTGIAGGVDARPIALLNMNTNGHNITFTHDDTASLVNNRIHTNSNMILAPGGLLSLCYEYGFVATVGAWHLISIH